MNHEPTLSPCGRHLLFSSLLQCPQPPSRSLPCPRHCGVGADAKARFPNFCLHPFSSHCPCFPGTTLELLDPWTEVPFFFSPAHFFLDQGHTVVSIRPFPDDWVHWTPRTHFQLSLMGQEWGGIHAHRLRTAGCSVLVSLSTCCLWCLPSSTSHCPVALGPGKRPTRSQ